MTHQEIIDRWNAQADEFNQWDALGEDEKLEWAMALEREACAKVCDALISNDADWDSHHWNQATQRCAFAIRARGNA